MRQLTVNVQTSEEIHDLVGLPTGRSIVGVRWRAIQGPPLGAYLLPGDYVRDVLVDVAKEGQRFRRPLENLPLLGRRFDGSLGGRSRLLRTTILGGGIVARSVEFEPALGGFHPAIYVRRDFCGRVL